MKLYRFEKNKKDRIKTISNKSIWISRPKEFNDLEDCSINNISHTKYDNTSYEHLTACIQILYGKEASHNFPLPTELQSELVKYVSYCRSTEKNILDVFSDYNNKSTIIDKVHNHIKESTGVCCFFGGIPVHPLMWAHYADNHQGFCIEYDVAECNHPIFEVNYSTSPFIASIHELLLCPHETLTRLLTTKNFEWNYEKEFRFIHLNELNNGEKGKETPLPSGIKACKLIKGARAENLKEINELVEALDIPLIDYQNFIRKNRNS